MRALLYLCFLGLCFAHARATLLPGVSVDEKQAKNVLGRRVKRDLHEECVNEGCSIEEVLENKSVLEECVFEGCNNEEVAEYPWVSCKTLLQALNTNQFFSHNYFNLSRPNSCCKL